MRDLRVYFKDRVRGGGGWVVEWINLAQDMVQCRTV
jgi:hypothetical protein